MQNLNNLSHVTDKNFNSKRELKDFKKTSCKSKTLRISQILGFYDDSSFQILGVCGY